jgi:hypothetical protein
MGGLEVIKKKGWQKMSMTRGSVQLIQVIDVYKGLPGYSDMTMSHVDALGRGSRLHLLAEHRRLSVEGEMRQGLTHVKGLTINTTARAW